MKNSLRARLSQALFLRGFLSLVLASLGFISEAQGSVVTQLIYLTAPHSVAVGVCSPGTTVERVDFYQQPQAVSTTTTINFSAPGVTFYSDAACTKVMTSYVIGIWYDQTTFYFRSTTAGTPTITTSSPGLISATQVATFTGGTPAAAKLMITTQPVTPSTAGGTNSIKVGILDGSGNLLTNSTAAVTVALGANPSGSVLNGTLTQNAVAGIATFSNLSIKLSGTGYTLVASSTGLTSTTSQNFTVNAAAAARLAFTVEPPAQVTAATALAPAIQVAVYDVYGNAVITPAPSVSLSIGNNPGAGTLSGTLTKVAANGVATFSDLSIGTGGSAYTLVASATGVPSTTSSAFNVSSPVVVTPPPAPTTSGNLIADSGFELGTNGFYANNSTDSLTRVTTNPIDGSASMRAVLKSWGSSIWWIKGVAGTNLAYGSSFTVTGKLLP